MDYDKLKRQIQQTILPDIEDRMLSLHHDLRNKKNLARAYLYSVGKYLEGQSYITTKRMSVELDCAYAYAYQLLERLEPFFFKKSKNPIDGRYKYFILDDIKNDKCIQLAQKCLGLEE